jgi:hypothetical protein
MLGQGLNLLAEVCPDESYKVFQELKAISFKGHIVLESWQCAQGTLIEGKAQHS